MTRRLPPLNALRAFEAAARHLSFTLAAEELNVTPAAVSHQVKALEDLLDVPLFHRLTRALRLTDAGQAALPALTDGFDKLLEGADRMRDHCESGLLTVSVSPSFGSMWLVPKLERFRSRQPEIEIRIDGTDRLVDVARGEADVAVRYGMLCGSLGISGFTRLRVVELRALKRPLAQALAAINPDALSPREALEALYQLKKIAA